MTNDNDLPAPPPAVGGIDVNGDVEAMFNLRDWMQRILESNDCAITGSGMGFGGGDLWFTHQGAEYRITVKPVMKVVTSNG